MRLVRDSELAELSDYLRRVGSGHADLEIRSQSEGPLSLLRNDIYKCIDRLNEHSEELEREREGMAEALADISHQLKTPLTSLMMTVDFLDDEALDADKRAAFLDDIRTALTRMEWLVGALLTFARLDAGSIEFKRETMPISDLVSDAVRDVAIMLEVRNQTLHIAGSMHAETITCDKHWTCEALTNIIKNASEHSPEGGSITVAWGTNPVSTFITVTDSGPGIKAEDIPGLFRRFNQSNKQGGTGIGLPLAQAIAKAQKGDIEVDSTSQGATFTLKLYK
jgi:signal transduction histidine kinase